MDVFFAEFKDMDEYVQIRHNIHSFLSDIIGEPHSLTEVAVNEAINNALLHGAKTKVTVEMSVTNGQLTVRVRDDGDGFWVQGVQESELMASGRGLFIMEAVADTVTYNKKRNEVELMMYLPEGNRLVHT